MITVE